MLADVDLPRGRGQEGARDVCAWGRIRQERAGRVEDGEAVVRHPGLRVGRRCCIFAARAVAVDQNTEVLRRKSGRIERGARCVVKRSVKFERAAQ